MTAEKLTLRQQRFLAAYFETGSASAAYRKAYDKAHLAPGTVSKLANRVMRHSLVAARMEQLRADLDARTARAVEGWGVTADRLIEEYKRIAFFDIGEVAQWNAAGELVLADSTKLEAVQRAGIASVALDGKTKSVKITTSIAGKLAALDSLARLLGLFDKDRKPPEESPLNLSITIA